MDKFPPDRFRLGDNCQRLTVSGDNCQRRQPSEGTTVRSYSCPPQNCKILQLSECRKRSYSFFWQLVIWQLSHLTVVPSDSCPIWQKISDSCLLTMCHPSHSGSALCTISMQLRAMHVGAFLFLTEPINLRNLFTTQHYYSITRHLSTLPYPTLPEIEKPLPARACSAVREVITVSDESSWMIKVGV